MVRDYVVIDRHDRTVAGPFKSSSDARQAAGSAGVVKFIPSKPARTTETRSAHHRPPRAHFLHRNVELGDTDGTQTTANARKTTRKPPHRAPRRAEPTDIEKANAAGVQYAEDQLEGDYFTDWVRDRLLEASRMPEDKVLPLKTKSDAMVIAKKMLRQLEWDTKRDLSAHDIERLIYADGTNPDAVDAFLEGFSATLELARDWLADELLEIKSEMGGRGRLSEERSNIRPRGS